jgi:hypothetical protein
MALLLAELIGQENFKFRHEPMPGSGKPERGSINSTEAIPEVA